MRDSWRFEAEGISCSMARSPAIPLITPTPRPRCRRQSRQMTLFGVFLGFLVEGTNALPALERDLLRCGAAG